jgi:hypothetical protein
MKRKGNKAQQHPHDHKESGNQNPSDGDVRVHGAIEVHPSPKLIAQHDADRKEDQTQKNKEYVVTKNTFWAVVVYSGLTFILVVIGGWNIKIARDTFVNSNRPYIGVQSISFFHVAFDSANKPIEQQRRTPDTRDFVFTAQIKNFGTVPGRNTAISWKVFQNGIYKPGTPKVPDNPFTHYPGQVIGMGPGEVGFNEYTRVMDGTDTLEIEVNVEYDGPSNHYRECEKERWDPFVNRFLNLGPCPQ